MLAFSSFFSFLYEICLKSIFSPVFGVCSTQTLVEMNNFPLTHQVSSSLLSLSLFLGCVIARPKFTMCTCNKFLYFLFFHLSLSLSFSLSLSLSLWQCNFTELKRRCMFHPKVCLHESKTSKNRKKYQNFGHGLRVF